MPRSPGSGGPELRNLARQAGIILRQTGQALGRRPVLSAEQLLAVLRLVVRLKRVAERAGDRERGSRAEADQNLARQAGDARRLAAQSQIGRRDRRSRTILLFTYPSP